MMANDENLIPLNQRTKNEQRKIAKQGGIASGKARREKSTLKETAKAWLEGKVPNQDLSGYEYAVSCLFKALSSPGTTVAAFNALRDLTGERPAVQLDANINSDGSEAFKQYVEALKDGK